MNDDRKIVARSWHNFHFLPHFNSKTTRLIVIKFLHDVEALAMLLTCTFTGQYCILFQNARAKSEGGQFRCLQKAPKINWLPQQHPFGYMKLISIL